eukprot:scaffold69367_cov90-Cyclotella_meneghiniana.AAC.8
MRGASVPGHFRGSTQCNIYPINVGQGCQGNNKAYENHTDDFSRAKHTDKAMGTALEGTLAS